MKLSVKWLCFVAVLALPMLAQAEPAKRATTTGSTSATVTNIEKIQSMLEYHQKMVSMIQSYMKDRPQIPADYRNVSDAEFLKKARAEKMMMPKREAPATSAPSTTNTAKPATRNSNPYSN